MSALAEWIEAFGQAQVEFPTIAKAQTVDM